MRNIARFIAFGLIFITPWEGTAHIPGMGPAARYGALGLVGFWLVTVVITGRLRKPGPFQVAVYLYVLWNAVSVFWSKDPGKTAFQMVTWVQLLGLVFIWWDLFTSRSDLITALQMYVLGAYVAFGSAVSNFFSGNVYYTNYQRFSAGETNPDGFGFLLVLGIPVAWYLASQESTTKWGSFLKAVNYLYVPAALLGIALSGTRTSFIAAIPGMAFGLASLTRVRLWVRIAIFVFLISATVIALPQLQTLTSFQRLSTTGEELRGGELNQRSDLWREGLDAFTERPLTGVGSNMYRSVNSLGKVAHNSFISVLVELGLIGIVLFGIVLMIAGYQAWGQPKWESAFWYTQMLVWSIGASSLTWEYKKTTWLFLSLLIVSAALTRKRNDPELLARPDKPVAQFVQQAQYNQQSVT